MALVLLGKDIVLEGSTTKNRGQTGSRCVYIYMYIIQTSSNIVVVDFFRAGVSYIL